MEILKGNIIIFREENSVKIVLLAFLKRSLPKREEFGLLGINLKEVNLAKKYLHGVSLDGVLE